MVRDSCLWDSGRWDGWGIILGLTSSFFRDIWSHKTSETLFLFVIFSILGRSRKKVNDHLTSPSNQFRDYFIWNRIAKWVPLNWNFAPHTSKKSQKTTNVFSNLDFLLKSGFPKTRDLSPAPPGGLIFPEMTTQQINFSGKLQKHQKSHFFW